MIVPPDKDSFPVPAARHRSELQIKRSRFIATVEEIASREEAMAAIGRVRREFADARHHCWAYIAGAPGDVHGVDKSDDGEPRGTAGKPMLNVLQHSGLGRIVVVVTRYFGGIKLGAGGLVRAYGQAVNDALAGLPTRTHHVCEEVTLVLPYALFDTLSHWLATADMRIIRKDFADDVTLVVTVPQSRRDAAVREIEEFGQGRLSVVGRD